MIGLGAAIALPGGAAIAVGLLAPLVTEIYATYSS